MTHTKVPRGSDLERLVDLLSGAGYVERDVLNAVRFGAEETAKAYVISHNPAGDTHRIWYRSGLSFVAYWDLTLPQGIGYTGFLCQFYFDLAGALLHHGVWE